MTFITCRVVAVGLLVLGARAAAPVVRAAPPQSPSDKVDDARTVVAGDIGRRLDSMIQRTSGGGFWGAALVAKNGRILLAKGYGFADYSQRPNSPASVFELASLSKQFTAAAILKLRMQGKLKLDDTLDKHFDEVPADKAGITIHQLLRHTAGISPKVTVPYATQLTRDELVGYVLEKPLATPPGKAHTYANVGYSLLAALVEKALGTSFEEYSREFLFKPAGLVDTGFIGDRKLGAGRVTTRLAVVAARVDPQATATAWHWGWGYRGMGGVVSTVGDVYRWDRALRTNQVLDQESRRLFYEPHSSGYACGWRVADSAAVGKRVFHSGSVQGYGTLCVRYLDKDAAIILLSNGRTNLRQLEQALDRLLFERPAAVTAVLDPRRYELNDAKSVMIENATSWKLRRDLKTITLTLQDHKLRRPVGRITVSLDKADELIRYLTAYLRVRELPGDPPIADLQPYLYLRPYATDGEIQFDRVEVAVLPQYRGRNRAGKRIVDPRITLTLYDAAHRQWPLMVRMNDSAARHLHKELIDARADIAP